MKNKLITQIKSYQSIVEDLKKTLVYMPHGGVIIETEIQLYEKVIIDLNAIIKGF